MTPAQRKFHMESAALEARAFAGRNAERDAWDALYRKTMDQGILHYFVQTSWF